MSKCVLILIVSGLTALAAPAPVVKAVVNAASFRPGVEAGTWITIIGENLSETTRTWNAGDFAADGKLPTSLDGVSVKFRGTSCFPAFISPAQINCLTSAASGSIIGAIGAVGRIEMSTLTVTSPAGTSAPFTLSSAFAAPGLFSYPAGDGKTVIAHTPQFELIGSAGLVDGVVTRPVKPGEVITVYATGFATPKGTVVGNATVPVAPLAPVGARFGRVFAKVLYAGNISPGLDQINLEIPAQVAGGAQEFVLSGGGITSDSPQGFSIPINAPFPQCSTSRPRQVDAATGATYIAWSPRPVYPAAALASRIQGTVRLAVSMESSGQFCSITRVDGDPLLSAAAIDALKYSSTKPPSQPVSFTVDVDFKLP